MALVEFSAGRCLAHLCIASHHAQGDGGTDRNISVIVHSLRLAHIYFVPAVAWQITLAFVSFITNTVYHYMHSAIPLITTL